MIQTNNNKMKKLNIFNSKKNSRVGQHGDQNSPTAESPTGDTLNRIVSAKEEAKKKWEGEQVEFRRRQREHQLQMIEIEQAEVKRREEEVRRLGEELDDVRYKNRKIHDTVQAQIEMLKHKLDDYKVEHKKAEETLEDDIATKEDMLVDVKATLEKRMKSLEDDYDNEEEGGGIKKPSAPLLTQESQESYDEQRNSMMYPTLPVPMARSVNSIHDQQQLVNPATRGSHGSFFGGKIKPPRHHSQESSPQTSQASSSRSVTPRTETTDNSDQDFSV